MGPENKHSPHHPSRLVLEQSKIEESSIPVRELVEVMYGEQVWGPIWINHLKVHLEAFTDLNNKLKIRDVGTEMEWISLNIHPFFQKRNTSPLPPVEDAAVGNLFYLFCGGQKVGPFTKELIIEKIESYQLMMTDPISLDMGKTWIKVYQIKEFDRRLREGLNEEHSDKEVDVLYKKLRNENIAGLKVLKNLTLQESTNPSYDLNNTTVRSQLKKSNQFDLMQLKWFGLFIVAFVGIVSVLRMWNDPIKKHRAPASEKHSSSFKAKQKQRDSINRKKKAIHGQALQQVKQIQKIEKQQVRKPASVEPPKPRVNKRANRRSRSLKRARSRSSKPITNSAAFKSTQRNRNSNDSSRSPASTSNDGPEELDVDRYTDDYDRESNDDDFSNTPDEQDPVRKQVSKETLDPREESGEDFEDNAPNKEENEDVYYSPTSKKLTKKVKKK